VGGIISSPNFLPTSILGRRQHGKFTRTVDLPVLCLTIVRLIGLFALGAFSTFSQPLTLGIKAGAPFTDFLNANQFLPGTSSESATSTTNPYVVGPTVELHLPANFSFEFDALFRHFRYQYTIDLIGAYSQTNTTSNAWEFPLLLKYKLPGRFLRPYVDGGVAWDRLQGVSATIFGAFFPGPTMTTRTSSPEELKHETSTGVVIGAGIDFHAVFLHISPEVRYARWTSQHVGSVGLLNSNQNQAEFLLGITF